MFTTFRGKYQKPEQETVLKMCQGRRLTRVLLQSGRLRNFNETFEAVQFTKWNRGSVLVSKIDQTFEYNFAYDVD